MTPLVGLMPPLQQTPPDGQEFPNETEFSVSGSIQVPGIVVVLVVAGFNDVAVVSPSVDVVSGSSLVVVDDIVSDCGVVVNASEVVDKGSSDAVVAVSVVISVVSDCGGWLLLSPKVPWS